ncbi:MAG: maleylpyruvate isomerase family mycothiol-dependent enzyme [Acidimicrobiales bacterium]|jgi:uncharacterized protein (TIGR03083 family)
MDRSTTLDSLDLESSRLLVAVSSGAASLDAPVANCPGWDVAQLLDHLGVIYSRVALIVSDRRSAPPSRAELPTAPAGEARVGWFAEQRAATLVALEAADDETLVWNWTATSPGPIGFWARRMAHETLIHRVDAELAQGSQPGQTMPEVAADTVAEFFELFLPRFEAKLFESWANDSIHLHASDVLGAEWTLRCGAGGCALTSEHAKTDVALRGSAFELACWAWGRLPVERLETFGDLNVAARFLELARV